MMAWLRAAARRERKMTGDMSLHSHIKSDALDRRPRFTSIQKCLWQLYGATLYSAVFAVSLGREVSLCRVY